MRPGGDDVAATLSARFGYDVPVLGRIPIDIPLREGGDTGRPVVVTHPESLEAGAFREVAGAIARQVSILAVAGQGSFVPAMTLTLKK